MSDYEQIARRLTEEEVRANARGLTSQSSRDILILARAVLEQTQEIERLQEELQQKDLLLIAGFKFGEREAT